MKVQPLDALLMCHCHLLNAVVNALAKLKISSMVYIIDVPYIYLQTAVVEIDKVC